jgi:ABC-type antimicrobial peptide transport system permease subunit
VRGEKESVLLQRSIRDAVRQVNRDQIVDNMKTLDEIRQESMGGDRFRSTLMGVFAGVALLLSAIGLYGVISYSVVQRTREIGIRTALGATPREIISLILRNGMKLTALGLVIGVAGTVGLAQALSSMLFNVDKYDPLTLVAVAVAMGAIALVACIIPALRAIRVNPNVALRHE